MCFSLLYSIIIRRCQRNDKITLMLHTRKEKVRKKACNATGKINIMQSFQISMVNYFKQLAGQGKAALGVADKPFPLPSSMKFPDFYATGGIIVRISGYCMCLEKDKGNSGVLRCDSISRPLIGPPCFPQSFVGIFFFIAP